MKKLKNDFSVMESILAFSIHENKNRMGKLLHYVGQLVEDIALTDEQKKSFQKIQYQVNEISSSLTDMLFQYKYQLKSDASLETAQCHLASFFEDTFARHELTREIYGFEMTYDSDDEVYGFFNEFVLSHLLDTCIYNAIQAGARKIHFKAVIEGVFLRIQIEDNGPGFPAFFEEERLGDVTSDSVINDNEAKPEVQKTGLGLSLLKTLIQAHKNKEVAGFARFSRSVKLGGAEINLFLP